MFSNSGLDPKGEEALSAIQNTKLGPMEELLYRAWAKANQIEKPEEPQGSVDLRGIYQASGGKVLPWGELKGVVDNAQHMNTLEDALYNQMKQRMESRTKEFVGMDKENAPKANSAGTSFSGPKPA